MEEMPLALVASLATLLLLATAPNAVIYRIHIHARNRHLLSIASRLDRPGLTFLTHITLRVVGNVPRPFLSSSP